MQRRRRKKRKGRKSSISKKDDDTKAGVSGKDSNVDVLTTPVTVGGSSKALLSEPKSSVTAKQDYEPTRTECKGDKIAKTLRSRDSLAEKENQAFVSDDRKENDNDSTADMEETLMSFIDTRDVDGIEAFLASIKGVPGRAALRKNAKKAYCTLSSK